MGPEQLKKQKILKKLRNALIALILPVLLLLLWEFAARQGWINEALMPRPSKIGSTLWSLTEKGKLITDVLVSLRRVLLGYIVGALLGGGLGILLGLFRKLNTLTSLLMEILRPIPVIAWVPVLILWIGIDEKSKVVVIAIGTFWPVLLNVISGIQNVDKKYLEVGQIFMKSRWVMVTKVILPAALPSIFTGLRIASGNALMSVVGAEMFAASSGIGYMISYAREMSQPAKMLAGVFVVGVLGCILNQIVAHIEKKRKY